MKKLTLIIYLVAFSVSTLQSQSVNLGLGGGYSTMTPPSTFPFSYENGTTWPSRVEELTGQEADIGFIINSSLEFQLLDTPLHLTAGISYSQLYGKAKTMKAQSPPWYGTVYTIGEMDSRSQILTFRTGAKYEILDALLSPYASIDILYNIIGDTKLTIKGTSQITKASIKGATQVGLALGGGVAIPILYSTKAVLEMNYSFNNLITPDTHEYQRNVLSIRTGFLFKVL